MPAATAPPGSRRRWARRAGGRRAARRARACRSGRSRCRPIGRARRRRGRARSASCRRRRSRAELDAVGRAVAADVRERLLGGAVEREPRLRGRLARRAGDACSVRAREASRARSSSRGQVVAAQGGDRLARLGEPARRRGGARARGRRPPPGRRRGLRASSRVPSSCSASADSECASTSCSSRATRPRSASAAASACAARDSRSSSRFARREPADRRMIKNHGSDAEQQAGDHRRVLVLERRTATSPPTVPPQTIDRGRRGRAACPPIATRSRRPRSRRCRAGRRRSTQRRDADEHEPDEARARPPLEPRGSASTSPAAISTIASVTSGPSPWRPGLGRSKASRRAPRPSRRSRSRAGRAAGRRLPAVGGRGTSRAATVGRAPGPSSARGWNRLHPGVETQVRPARR